MAAEDKYILFNPGPVNISERVRASLQKPDLCHREQEFSDLLQNIKKKLLKVYNLGEEYTAVVLTGSGTAAVESAIVSLVPENGKLLILSNGVYGERISNITSVRGIAAKEIKLKWGEMINLTDVERELEEDKAITTVAVVHHETTTGILNDIGSIGRLSKKYGKEMLVDAVSSFAGEEIKFNEWGVDICCGSSNKCIHGIPGAAFVIIKRNIIERQKSLKPRSVYLDLVNYYVSEEKGIPPFTPCIQVLYAFNEALNELLTNGVEARIRLYRGRANLIRQLAQRIGLKLYLPQDYYSNTLTSFHIPDRVTYETLHNKLKEHGYIIYAGQGGLQKNIFRIANMGEIMESDIERLFKLIGEIIKEKQ